MEIPWKLMFWTALISLLVCSAIFGLYYLTICILKIQNRKLSENNQMTKKKIKSSAKIISIFASALLVCGLIPTIYSLFLNYSVVFDTMIYTGDRTNGFNNKIGEVRYTYINKSDLLKCSKSKFKTFLDEDVKKQNMDKYIYFMIFCNDGTGIYISNPDNPIMTYGEVDQEAAIITTLGYIVSNETGDFLYLPENSKIPADFFSDK